MSDRQLVWGHYGDSTLVRSTCAELCRRRRKISVETQTGGVREDADQGGGDGSRDRWFADSAQAAFNSDTGIAVVRVNGNSITSGQVVPNHSSLGHDSPGQFDFSASGNSIWRILSFHRRYSEVGRCGAMTVLRLATFEKQVGDGLLSGLTWDAK